MSHPQLDRSTREVELGLDYGTPTMNLAGQSLKFENGQWIAGGLHFLPFCPSKMVEQPPLGDRWLCPFCQRRGLVAVWTGGRLSACGDGTSSWKKRTTSCG